jgi:hypothetical protein
MSGARPLVLCLGHRFRELHVERAVLEEVAGVIDWEYPSAWRAECDFDASRGGAIRDSGAARPGGRAKNESLPGGGALRNRCG